MNARYLPPGPHSGANTGPPLIILLLMIGGIAVVGYFGLRILNSRAVEATAPVSLGASQSTQERARALKHEIDSNDFDDVAVHADRVEEELVRIADQSKQLRTRLSQIRSGFGPGTSDFQIRRAAAAEALSEAIIQSIGRALAELDVARHQLKTLQPLGEKHD